MLEKKFTKFVDRFSIALRLAGITRAELSQITGIPESRLFVLINSGIGRFLEDQLRKLAKAMNVNYVWFVTGFGAPFDLEQQCDPGFPTIRSRLNFVKSINPNLSLRQISKKLHSSESTAAAWFSERANPMYSKLMPLSKLFNCNFIWLVCGVGRYDTAEIHSNFSWSLEDELKLQADTTLGSKLNALVNFHGKTIKQVCHDLDISRYEFEQIQKNTIDEIQIRSYEKILALYFEVPILWLRGYDCNINYHITKSAS